VAWVFDFELALFLLVAGVFADHADDVVAFDDLAAFTEPLDRCTDFHGTFG
jgi:hypothetical protein